MQQQTDYTTPAAILAGTLLALGMLGVLMWGPPALSEKLGELFFGLAFILITAFGVILKSGQTRQEKKIAKVQETAEATHRAVNSQMDAAKAQISESAATAATLALTSADERVRAAREAGLMEGHAAGLATGQAQALAGLAALAPVVPAAAVTPAQEAPLIADTATERGTPW